MTAPTSDWPNLPDPYVRMPPEQRAQRALTAELVAENVRLLSAWSANVAVGKARTPDECNMGCRCVCHREKP